MKQHILLPAALLLISGPLKAGVTTDSNGNPTISIPASNDERRDRFQLPTYPAPIYTGEVSKVEGSEIWLKGADFSETDLTSYPHLLRIESQDSQYGTFLFIEWHDQLGENAKLRVKYLPPVLPGEQISILPAVTLASAFGAMPQSISTLSVSDHSLIIHTSENHGLKTGDKVQIADVSGDSAVNGVHPITYISRNSFKLEGYVASGSYSGGTWIHANWPNIGNNLHSGDGLHSNEILSGTPDAGDNILISTKPHSLWSTYFFHDGHWRTHSSRSNKDLTVIFPDDQIEFLRRDTDSFQVQVQGNFASLNFPSGSTVHSLYIDSSYKERQQHLHVPFEYEDAPVRLTGQVQTIESNTLSLTAPKDSLADFVTYPHLLRNDSEGPNQDSVQLISSHSWQGSVLQVTIHSSSSFSEGDPVSIIAAHTLASVFGQMPQSIAGFIVNSEQVTVHTLENHGLNNGDLVHLQGVTGEEKINSTHTIHRTGETTFTLETYTANGPYFGGTWHVARFPEIGNNDTSGDGKHANELLLGTPNDADNIAIWNHIGWKTYFYHDNQWSTHGSRSAQDHTILYPGDNLLFIRRDTDGIKLQIPALKQGSPLEPGWHFDNWVGTFYKVEDSNWIYHATLGWVYLPYQTLSSHSWAWNETLGWFWVGRSLFPYLYCNSSQNWLYYYADDQGNPWFFDFKTQEWTALD